MRRIVVILILAALAALFVWSLYDGLGAEVRKGTMPAACRENPQACR